MNYEVGVCLTTYGVAKVIKNLRINHAVPNYKNSYPLVIRVIIYLAHNWLAFGFFTWQENVV